MTAEAGDMIHVVTGADEGFSSGLLVTVASALVTLAPERPTTVHILDGGLASETIGRLKKMTGGSHRGSQIIFHPVREEKFAGFKAGIRNSRMYYARLAIGSLVSADKAIYLDADVVVLGGLAGLWELDMGGKMILAALDRKIRYLREDCPWPIPDTDTPYFNTGVMLMDLRGWREADAESQAMRLAGEAGEKCRWYDQTVINYMLRDRIGKLPEEWNWQREAVPDGRKIFAIHFTTGKKPWLYRGPDARFRIWRAYYEFAAGSTLPLFINRMALPGLFFGLLESLLRKSPALRRSYVRLLGTRLRTARDAEKKRRVAGTIGYFTAGPGGPAGDSDSGGGNAVVADVRKRLRNWKPLQGPGSSQTG